MSRIDKSDYRAATFRLPPELLERLDRYAARTGTVKGFTVEQALTEYLDRMEGRDAAR